MSWLARAFPLLRPALFALEPERAHALTIAALQRLPLGAPPADDPRLAVDTLGLRFVNPLGLAAGFDKNAEVPDAMLRLGMGFAEVGTITPRPQPGNPRPRVFRLNEDAALINRLGFNNAGLAPALARLKARSRASGIVGGNVGANKDSADRLADYATGVAAVAPFVDYITINISSPNTPGLRALQSRESLIALVRRCQEARGAHAAPLLVKVAPDLQQADVDDIAAVALETGLDGLIVSNTTVARPDCLESRHRGEAGGLSGAPLFQASTAMLRAFAARLGGAVTLVGVGGIASGADAYAKIRAGASLVQLYTGLVYHGPGLIGRIKRELLDCLQRDGIASVAEAIGADVQSGQG